ncbi:MAG: sigma-54 interaction domain-containing protein [Arenimonas sp.]
MGIESRQAATPVSIIPGVDECNSEQIITASNQPVSVYGMIGNSAAFLTLLRQIGKIARTDACVLIEGETGVGKELTARAIHYLSTRRSKPFISLNCGAIPETLIESELFGHARGAFTDAKTNRCGVISQADAGTLFLDEIDSLPCKGQVALLRFLQDRRYRPVGQSAEQVSNSRVIAATNQPLQDLVERRAFRSDLMYRLNILRLQVPPLRERKTDIVLLAKHFLKVYCERYGLPLKTLHSSSWVWMMRYEWPGNVRELESVIHRNVLLSEDHEIIIDECAPQLPSLLVPSLNHEFLNFQDAKAHAIAEFERGYLLKLFHETQGNVSAAARLACKERRSLGKLLKKYGIDKAGD